MSSLPLIPSVSATPTARSSSTSTSTSTFTTPNPFGHTGFAEILSQIQTSKGQQYTTPVFDSVAGEEVAATDQPAIRLVTEESSLNAFTMALKQAAGVEADSAEATVTDASSEKAPASEETEKPIIPLAANEAAKVSTAVEDAVPQPIIAGTTGNPTPDIKGLKMDSVVSGEPAKIIPTAVTATPQQPVSTGHASATAFHQVQTSRLTPQQSVTSVSGGVVGESEGSATTSATVSLVASGDTEGGSEQGQQQPNQNQQSKATPLIPLPAPQASAVTPVVAQQGQVAAQTTSANASTESQPVMGTSQQSAPVAASTSTSGQLAQAVMSSSEAAARANTVQQLAAPLRSSVVRGVDGTHTTVVKMSPESLGPVSIEATTKDGVLRIELIATTDAGRDALRASLNDLRRELAGTGAQLDMGGNGTASKETGQNSSRDGQRQSGPKSDLPHDENLMPQQFASNTDTEKGTSSNGSLDIMA